MIPVYVASFANVSSYTVTITRKIGNIEYPVPFYDDGFGNLFVMRNSMGLVGIVRAMTWHDAYSCFEDEILPDPNPSDMESWEKEYGKEFTEHPVWQESYGFRNNTPSGSNLKTPYYERDLNGESLDMLTAEIVETYKLKIVLD